MRYVILIGLVAMSMQPIRRADPELHLIPSGYRGKVQILFRASNGVPAKFENGAHVYDIPPDGLLLTQAAPNEGSSPEYQFVFVTPGGERQPIRRIYTQSPTAEVGISFIRRGRFQAGQPASCDIPTYEYFVGNDTDLANTDEAEYYLRRWPVVRDHYVCP